jgi:3-hydroxybutyryl-CoA dehydrogenase
MGRGIALVFARAGHPTTLYDIDADTLTAAQAYIEGFLDQSVAKQKLSEGDREATLARLRYRQDRAAMKGDFILEAVPERLDLKHLVLGQAAAQNPPETILASNTSTLPITRIAAELPHPERVVGMHFFNPAPLMKLVEVIAGAETSPAVRDQVYALAQALGKQPVRAQDQPGFIVNRVARQFYLESLRSVEQGGTDPATLDRLMRSQGFRMGPFELMDLIGVETNHAVSQSMYEAFFFEERFRPSRLQQQKVDAGHHGRKRGKGFYDHG